MIPSSFDPDDGLYPHPLLALLRVALPTIVDVCKSFSPIRDQGQLGTCALETMVAFLEFHKPKPVIKQSVLFPYYNVRLAEGTVGEDSGCEPRDVFKSMIKDGECDNKYWPYYISRFAKKPSVNAYAHSRIPAIVSYHALTTFLDVKTILASGNPVYIGMAVYESFESEEVAATGIMPMPKANEQILGYHAVPLGGYDDTKQLLKLRNSWGAKWGDHGYFHMPYAYFIDKYITDKWAITL
jgi:C1A family cysteine protease